MGIKSKGKRVSDTVVAQGSWQRPKYTPDSHGTPTGLKPQEPVPPKAKEKGKK